MKHGTQKVVTVIGHSFDCLPAHVQITGRGTASTVRVAAARAVEDLITSRELHRKHVTSFKLSLVINHQRQEVADASQS